MRSVRTFAIAAFACLTGLPTVAEQFEPLDARIELVCDARNYTLTARMIRSDVAPLIDDSDPFVRVVLDKSGYDLHNTRILAMTGEEGAEEDAPSADRSMLAITKTPTRLFCSVEDEDYFAAGDMTIDRSPGNINPMGRCGAAEIVTLSVTFNSEPAEMIDMIGDCHFAEEFVTDVTLDLKTGDIARKTMPVGDFTE